jgi:hypothetical protein
VVQEHPWVTKNGTDRLLSEEENTSDLVEPPTEAEMNAAITNNVRNLMTVVRLLNWRPRTMLICFVGQSRQQIQSLDRKR